MHCRLTLLLIVLLMALPACVVAGLSTKTTLTPGSKAPDFTFSNYVSNEKSTYYESYPETPTLIAFIQTACRSCKREVAFIKTLLNDVVGFKALLVFIDHKNNFISKYIESNGIASDLLVVWDNSDEITKKYGVNFSPASFLVDKNKQIAVVYKGFHKGTSSTLRKDLEKLLEN